MAALKELELMIQSRYPLIAIATVEEDRLEKALEDIADDLKVPFWLWSLTGGLKRRGVVRKLPDLGPGFAMDCRVMGRPHRERVVEMERVH